MVLLNQEIRRAYDPYRKESKYCFMEMTFAVLFGILVVIVFQISDPIVLLLLGKCLLFCVFLDIIVNHRIALLSRIEEHWKLYDAKVVRIISISDEYSFSGKYYESVVTKLYSKELGIHRRRINCIDSDFNELKLRSVMGHKNAQLVIDEVRNEPSKKRAVLVGRYTHIIVKYCDSDDIAFRLNRML